MQAKAWTRLGRLLAATALAAPAIAGPARAQTADVPSRVGRLALIAGTVSAHGAGGTSWSPAVINTPLSTGDALWTQPGSGATIDLAGNAIVLSEATELDLATIGDTQFAATEPQGELFLDLRQSVGGDGYGITTPRGVVTLQPGGEYDLVAGGSDSPTLIGVIAGAAQIQSGTFSLSIAAGQTATVSGSDALQGSIGPLIRDGFLQARLARPAPPASGPTQVRYMTGAATLASYGSWQPQAEYGQVWYPQVGTDWAPYREGSWSYVQPWGWTWVDAEPWGFAPFHYGRWAQFGGRWGWVPCEPGAPPAVYERPAYAPALVDFVAAGAVAGALAGAAAVALDHGGPGGNIGGSNIGWIPLGPHEPYQPPFHAGPTYLQRVNYGRIDNTRITNNTTIINNYVNRNAMTVVPATAMANSEPVRGIARTGIGAFGAAAPGGQPAIRTLGGAALLRPVAETHGLTPVAAHALGLGPITRPAAPGPEINQALFHPHALPASRAPFRTGVQPVAAGAEPGPHGVEPLPGVHPQAAVTQPVPAAHPGLPSLRPAGAVPPGIAPHQGPAVENHVEAGHAGLGRPAPARTEPAPAAPVRAETIHPGQAHPGPAHAEGGPVREAAGHPEPQAPREAPHPEIAHPAPARPEPRPQPHPEPHAEPHREAPHPAPHPASAPHGEHRDEHPR